MALSAVTVAAYGRMEEELHKHFHMHYFVHFSNAWLLVCSYYKLAII